MDVNCLSCNHKISLPYEISYQYYICINCFKLHRKENGILKLLDSNRLSFNYNIPIGTTIDFENQTYVVANVILKKDLSFDSWLEYELLSENNTKKYFTEENGNWTVSEEIAIKKFDKTKKEIYHEGVDYRLFDKGKSNDYTGVGFFEYEINNKENIAYYDFICPPNLLSVEIEDGEYISYLGKHISAKDVKVFSIFNQFLAVHK